MKWSTIKMYVFGTNMWGTLITGTLFKPFSTGIENINHIGGNRTKEAKKRRNCQAFSFRWPCQISCKYCWTTYWEMAIFCSLAIKVSMKLVSLSSREFRMAPGDSIFAARKKKKNEGISVHSSSHLGVYRQRHMAHMCVPKAKIRSSYKEVAEKLAEHFLSNLVLIAQLSCSAKSFATPS